MFERGSGQSLGSARAVYMSSTSWVSHVCLVGVFLLFQKRSKSVSSARHCSNGSTVYVSGCALSAHFSVSIGSRKDERSSSEV
jgi:hypothetical protein